MIISPGSKIDIPGGQSATTSEEILPIAFSFLTYSLGAKYASLKFITISGSIKGIILNNYNTADLMHRDNLTSIEKLTAIKVIATVEKNAKEINIEKEDLLKIFEEI